MISTLFSRKAALVAILLVAASTLLAQVFPHTIDLVIPINTSIMAEGVSLRDGNHPAGSCTPTAIIMPASWTAADLTFQISIDGTTFNDVYDDSGNEVVVTAAASRFIRLSPGDWWGTLSLKVRSGTANTPVTQTAARTLKLVCR